jgi:hypothetical protein
MPTIIAIPALSFANLVSCLALFLALGSGAYAAVELPKNSVGPKQLRKNSVTTVKIRKGAVTGAKIDLASLGVVPQAAHADDSSALGGRTAAQITDESRPRCPTGTIAVAGACIESEPAGPQSAITAIAECAKKDRRLASVGELAALNRNHLAEANKGYWADILFETPAAQTGAAFVGRNDQGGLLLGVGSATQQHEFRCVIPAE